MEVAPVEDLVSKVRNDAFLGLKQRDVSVVNIQREYALTIYELRVSGYIPMYVRFDTHLGRTKTQQEAEKDWQKYHKGFIKRCSKMLTNGEIWFSYKTDDDEFDEYANGINIWTGLPQMYCFIRLTHLLTLRIPFILKEASASADVRTVTEHCRRGFEATKGEPV